MYFKRISQLLTIPLAGLLLSGIAWPQDDPDEGIAPQPLTKALTEFAEHSGLQLVYFTEVTEGLDTQGAETDGTPEETLDQLLADTGLRYEFINDRTISIEPQGISSDASAELTEPGKSQPASSPVLMAQNQTSAPQTQTTNNSDDEGPVPVELENIIVTGSRIRGAQSASPVVTITRQEIDQGGFATVEELIEKLPQNFGAGASQDTLTAETGTNLTNFVGGIVDALAGGTSVNLRGLGASSTLILLNGRRMSPSGRSARFTNISSIPVTAIERVEVLTDGASAIYGSDAIGGVVNFVLRDSYDGAETRLRYGSAMGDKPEILLGQSFGNSWEGGNLLFTYEYFDSDNLANVDRDITSTADLTRFGGIDWRAPGGNPANIDAGGQLFAIPTGQDGTSLTSADFDASAPLNFHNHRLIGDVIMAQKRHTAMFQLNQSIGSVDLFAEARFSTEENETRRSNGTIDIDVPGDDPLTPAIEGNPFFVDPTNSGLTMVTVEDYAVDDDIGPQIDLGEIDSFGATLGVRFDMGESWHGELLTHWSKEEATLRESNRLDAAALATAASQTTPETAFNPFGDGSNTNLAVIESIVDRTSRVENDSENELWSVNLNFNGALFDMAGGAVQVATGVEFREDSLFSLSDPAEGGTPSDTDRDVVAVYAEFFLPLISDVNRRAGFHRLEISLAGRYENYSDFGDTTNPKLGFVWSPTSSLNIRGTYGTSFRAPALFDLDVTNLSANGATYLPQLFVDLGIIPTTLLTRFGGNEGLRPEEATTWTAGFDWSPEGADGLSLSMTYFDVDFDDRIEFPASSILTIINDPRFSSLFNTSPTPEEIAAVVTDPRFRETSFGRFTPVEDFISGALPVGGIVDIRKQNLSQSVVTGAELQLLYSFDTSVGAFDIGLNGNYLFDFERAFISGDPLVEEVDTYGRPVDFRARGNVTWTRNKWSVSGFVNYLDGYTDNINDPARPVDSWTTIDLTIVYDTGDKGGILGDMRVSLIAQNLFDEDPPFVNAFAGLAYDTANASALGQFIALQIAKEW